MEIRSDVEAVCTAHLTGFGEDDTVLLQALSAPTAPVLPAYFRASRRHTIPADREALEASTPRVNTCGVLPTAATSSGDSGRVAALPRPLTRAGSMKRTTRDKFDEVRLHWRNYVFQSALAAAAIFLVLLVLSLQEAAVVVASIGATAFIVFAMPNSITAQPRNVIGGHFVGMMSGALFASLAHPLALKSIVMFPLAVGLSVFVMVVTDTEHPPASGTALGVAMTGLSLDVALAVATSAVVLSLIHHLLGAHLRDLT